MGGCIQSLYDKVGETAVFKATPKIMAKGCIITGGVILGLGSVAYLGNKGYTFLKDRKNKIDAEELLKQEFAETIEIHIDEEENS